jgi:DNA-binding transcriptional MerR regulator
MVAPPSSPPLPDKLYFRIGEVSRISGLPTSVLRFWERDFPRIKPQRTEKGQRLYRKSEVVLILTIKHLLYERKFTIKGAIRYIQSQAHNRDLSSVEKSDLLAEIRDELEQIRRLLDG